jgi:hypothetical protein
VAIIAVGYIVMHPPAPVRRRLAPYARKLGRTARRLRRWRGRPGESKLLRWAEEELPIFGLGEDDDGDRYDGEIEGSDGLFYNDDDGFGGKGRKVRGGEVDEMVNARAMAETEIGGAEEQIPLRPSLTKPSFTNYGAAGGNRSYGGL